jgi:UDP-N-acetylglucosamine 2-epimerase (non-hydrolysing)
LHGIKQYDKNIIKKWVIVLRKIKVLTVFGTRPEATKMVPVILMMKTCEHIDAKLCVTAQHRELLDQVLAPFDIKPDYDLNLMTPGQQLSDITARALKGLEGVIREARPDLLLVHGDTTTTFAAALAAFYAQVKVGHVEAGLRTYDKYRPFPEEINRKLASALADLHFAPTMDARGKLLAENVPDASIYVTGNTAIDFMRYTTTEHYIFHDNVLNGLDYTKRVILMTAHRRENWGEPLENIDRAAARLTRDFDDVLLVYAMHPNPRVTEPARRILGSADRVVLTGALDVFDLHNLLRRAYLVLTDSGGLQEEAAGFHKPLVLMRETTERPEALAAGALKMAGVGEDDIYAAAAQLLTDEAAYASMASALNPFGDGHASERIVQAILHEFGIGDA